MADSPVSVVAPAPARLAVRGLGLARGGRQVLADVSFDVRPGEIVVVIGPNGAGKTTLLEVIAGLWPHAAGEILFDGSPLRGLRARSNEVAYLADAAEPPDEVSVEMLVAHARRLGRLDAAAAAELEARLGLGPLKGARAGQLSRGERRRVVLFEAACSGRPLLVLDEPLGVFDPLQLLDLLDVLRTRVAAGAALLASVHQMSDAEKLGSRLLLLREGRALAFGTLDELRSRAGGGATLVVVFLRLLQGRDVASA